MTRVPANLTAVPLEERADIALKIAVEKVILEHAEKRLPVYIWRDGAVVEICGEELQRVAARIREE